jgi:hypothetical protein
MNVPIKRVLRPCLAAKRAECLKPTLTEVDVKACRCNGGGGCRLWGGGGVCGDRRCLAEARLPCSALAVDGTLADRIQEQLGLRPNRAAINDVGVAPVGPPADREVVVGCCLLARFGVGDRSQTDVGASAGGQQRVIDSGPALGGTGGRLGRCGACRALGA